MPHEDAAGEQGGDATLHVLEWGRTAQVRRAHAAHVRAVVRHGLLRADVFAEEDAPRPVDDDDEREDGAQAARPDAHHLAVQRHVPRLLGRQRVVGPRAEDAAPGLGGFAVPRGRGRGRGRGRHRSKRAERRVASRRRRCACCSGGRARCSRRTC